MFGGLKDKIGGGAIDKIKSLKPSDVNNDSKFDSLIIAPMLLSISGASGGVTKLIPKFDSCFKTAMFHVRNELIEVEGEKIKLVEGGQQKLPSVLVEGFKKSA